MVAFCDNAVAVREGEELDLARLGAYLGRHFDGPGPVTVEQFPSGHSNLTYRVNWGGRELVLRRPPFGSQVKSAHDMGREYRVLSKLHEAYNVAPKVILYCDDLSVLGAPFYLMEPIRGVILRRQLPAGLLLSPATALELSQAFLDNLICLHSLDYDKIGLGDLGKPQGYLERQVKRWIERYHNSATHDLPEVGPISAWLTQHIPASSDAALIHNDYKYDNVVLDSNDITRIVGVLDWEMCTLGDPLSDLGTTLAYWTDPGDPDELQEVCSAPTTIAGTLTRAQLAQRYALGTGRAIHDMVFYLTFARFKVAVIVQQIYYRYDRGLTHDERFAIMPHRIAVLMRASLQCAESGTI
ncbi:MAG TPA: phosphotransferase family protein [Candidatus Sulfotelmatobacter sp.]|jgi:aminoglycoside phosphotransferase (APT) family kinase protein|nr:phosphotransferase family protein [Candidatus Sulfotelmatobacter sp.]